MVYKFMLSRSDVSSFIVMNIIVIRDIEAQWANSRLRGADLGSGDGVVASQAAVARVTPLHHEQLVSAGLRGEVEPEVLILRAVRGCDIGDRLRRARGVVAMKGLVGTG